MSTHRSSRTLRAIGAALALTCIAGATARAGVNVPPVTQALQAIPLGAFSSGATILQNGLSRLSPSVKFTFLDKEYENDVWVTDKITGIKARVSCVRFKASSGFQFTVDPPQHTLTPQELTLRLNIAKIKAEQLAIRFMFGPCAWTGTGLGVQLTDVKLTYKVRPMLSFDDQGACRLVWNNDADEAHVSIGDLNILGVQNDIDKLAKDATREAINLALDTYFSSILRGEVMKAAIDVCGKKKRR